VTVKKLKGRAQRGDRRIAEKRTDREIVRRPGRAAKVRAKRAASAMGTVEDLAAVLGCGRNQAYDLVNSGAVKAFKPGRRWMIPRVVLNEIAAGEFQLPDNAISASGHAQHEDADASA
jgi:excisionase family DNA binding protein